MAMESAEILSAIITGLVVGENSKEVALQTCTLLKKICDNARKPDEKFKRLPANNKTVNEKVKSIVGGSEILDAIGFVREDATGDLVLQFEDDEILSTASMLLQSAITDISGEPQQYAATTATTTTTTLSEADKEYLERKRIADQRAADIRARAEADKKQKEQLRTAMQSDQKEVGSRPVVASVRHEYTRAADGGSSGGGSASASGAIPYLASNRELDALIKTGKPTLVNFTASWCGPCQMIAPEIEKMKAALTTMNFAKVDVDVNAESASKWEVSALPTFIYFRDGKVVGRVKGANVDGVKRMIGSG